MRIGLAVDSACDLPPEFIAEHGIVVLPISLRLGDTLVEDRRDPEETLEFYQKQLASKGINSESVPYSTEQIKSLFLKDIVVDYDYVFCITITQSRSPIFDNATQAAFAILKEYKDIRKKAGVEGPFAVRVVNSRNMFAAQGALVAEAVSMIKSGVGVNDLRRRLTDLADHSYGYMMPNDLYYIRARGKKKGEKSVGLVSAALGTALDIKPIIRCHQDETAPVAKVKGFEQGAMRIFDLVSRQIRKGLKAKHVAISYGGDPTKVTALPGFDGMAKVAREHGVALHLSIQSMTAGVNVGEGALVVGFLAEPHEFNEGS